MTCCCVRARPARLRCVMWETSTLQFIDWGQLATIHWGLVLSKGEHCLSPYLPLRISCCLMFFMKWTFLKLFGRGEPDRVRHLKCKTNTKYQHVKKLRESDRYITMSWMSHFRHRNIVADKVCMYGVSVQFNTCVEEHSPQCPLTFQAKSAERWVFV